MKLVLKLDLVFVMRNNVPKVYLVADLHKTLNLKQMKIEVQNSNKPQKPQLNILAVMCRTFSNIFFGLVFNYLIHEKKNMEDLIILSLVKYSDGNILICQLHFVNNGDLNGYTKAMIITMTAIIIALQLVVCKSRMAHNG